MWIFLRDGFASIRSVNKHSVMLRFRRRDHADRFAGRLGVNLMDVAESEGTDYRYRIVISRRALARMMTEEAESLDYDNFKNACGLGDYHDML